MRKIEFYFYTKKKVLPLIIPLPLFMHNCSNCIFQNNRAFRHGGALAIQTIREVEIINCDFEKNVANCNFDSNSELLEDHFYKKKEGRGGAIYINPTASCVKDGSYMQTVTINNCDFLRNNAHDGYAMYIEGDDPGTKFVIIKNHFNDNFNESNHNENDIHRIFGAVITTEIFSITSQSLHPADSDSNNNYFSNKDSSLIVPELSYVDHFGHTATREFTESDYFPSNNFTFSTYFSKSEEFSVSSDFTRSAFFKESGSFSNSQFFSKSSVFSKTDSFSKTFDFTKSEVFIPTNYFTESCFFSDQASSNSNGDEGLEISSSSVNDIDSSTNDESSIEQSSEDESSIEQSSEDESSIEQSSEDESSIEQSSEDESSIEQSSEDESSTEQSSEDESSIEQSSDSFVETSGESSFSNIDESLTESNNNENLSSEQSDEESSNDSDYDSHLSNSHDESSNESSSDNIDETSSESSSDNNDSHLASNSDESSNDNSVEALSESSSTSDKGADVDSSSISLDYESKNDHYAESTSPNPETVGIVDRDPGTSSFSRSSKKSKLPLIIGLVVGIFVLLVIIVIIVIHVIKRKKNDEVAEEYQVEMSDQENTSISANGEEFDNPLFAMNVNKDPFDDRSDVNDI